MDTVTSGWQSSIYFKLEKKMKEWLNQHEGRVIREENKLTKKKQVIIFDFQSNHVFCSNDE